MNEEEWLACEDPRAMLSFLGGRASERKLRLFAVACCRSLWRLVEDQRGHQAVEVAERWADGLAARDELIDSRSALAEALREARLRAIREADREGITWAVVTFHADQAKGAMKAAAEVAARGEFGGDALRARFRHRAAWGAMLTIGSAISLTSPAPGEDALAGTPPAIQCDHLRELFGNPFRPAPLIHASLFWNRGRAGTESRREETRYRAGSAAPADGPADAYSALPEPAEAAWAAAADLAKPPGLSGEPGRWMRLARAAYDERDFSALPALADALEEAGCTDEDVLDHLRSPGPHLRGCWALDLVLGKE